LAYQWSFGGTNLSGATSNVLVITNVGLSQGGSYAVQVSNAFGLANSSNALLTIGVPPVILTQPTNLAIPAGGVATFNVLAGGTAPLNHQWSFNGTNLLNATNSTLVITNAHLSDAGTYAAKVSNAFGSAASSNAVLIVGTPPTIVSQPTNQTIALGSSAVFTVLAAGTSPLAYQWTFGGTSLSGATSNVLVITNVSLSKVGSYAAWVSNAFGSASSSNASNRRISPFRLAAQPPLVWWLPAPRR
jgi:FAD synthase